MEFPRSNKIRQELPEKIGENAKRLEEIISAADWKKIGKFLAIGYAAILIAVFLMLVVIRFAFAIF
mgnify:CR=1 FL=1